MRSLKRLLLLGTMIVGAGMAASVTAAASSDSFPKLLASAQRDFRFEMTGLNGLAVLLKPTLVEGMFSQDYVTMLSDAKLRTALDGALARVKAAVDAHPRDLTYRDLLDQTSVVFDIAPQGVSACARWPMDLSYDRYLVLDVLIHSDSEQVEVDVYVQEHP